MIKILKFIGIYIFMVLIVVLYPILAIFYNIDVELEKR
jgi:hypothetical protein